MESSKEELQSLNEELQTVNAELQSKVEELSAAHDDMSNLLNSTEVATIFVDNNMRIRRFTAEATKIVNLIQTDIGRLLEHVVTNLRYKKMIPDLSSVLKKLMPKEVEVQTADKKWFFMRILPYRTTDNRIDGAVLTFTDIDDLKKAQQTLKTMQAMEVTQNIVRSIFDMSHEPMVVLDANGKIVIANTRYCELANTGPKEIAGLDFLASCKNIPKELGLKTKLNAALKQNNNFETDTFEIETSNKRKRCKIVGQIIEDAKELPYRILLHFSEVR